MKTAKVRLNTIDKVKRFVNIAMGLDCDIDFVSGKHIIDAKSIMGIFSLDLSKDIEMQIYVNNEAEYSEYLSMFNEFLV